MATPENLTNIQEIAQTKLYYNIKIENEQYIYQNLNIKNT